MKLNLKNKVVLVTGGTRGIGKEITNQFLSSGSKVIITGTKKKEDYILPKKNIRYLQLDTTQNDSISLFFENIKKIQSIDILINNLGINPINYIDQINERELNLVITTNLKIPILLSKLISKKMKLKKKGKILNISSIWGIVSKPKRISYSSSKSGLNGLTRALAVELAKYNILVNSISPGFVKTDLTIRNLGKNINDIKKQVPLNRLASTKEIAFTSLFLCSDLNTYITGQNIIVDGGFTAI
tara:strand:+ start:74 stop:802 length:729 start_codon:yes stop_codon:yes gene_type:complete